MSFSATQNGLGTRLFENLPQYTRLTVQGTSVVNQFEQLGDLEYLERGIAHLNEAIELTPVGHPYRSIVLQALAWAYMLRFKHCGDVEAIKKATVYCTEAVNTAPEELVAPMLNTLGIIYVYRFSAFGRSEDLELSLSCKAQAICLTPPDANYLPGLFNELGLLLHSRFKHLKSTQDIHHAIMCQEQSLIGTHQREEYPGWLMNLGAALRDRFQYLDRAEDIDKSINCLRRAAEITPASQIGKKALCLNNLASALSDRFYHRGKLADPDECILVTEESVLHGPNRYPEKARSLNNLGYCLQQRFERLGDIADINRAVVCQEESISLSLKNGILHPGFHNNLGNSLSIRFRRLNDPSDLSEAIRHLEEAVKTASPSDALRYKSLSNLGTCHLTRFRVEGNIEDIDAAIEHLRKSTLSTHGNDADRARWHRNLGTSYRTRFKHFHQIEDLNNAIKNLNHACSLIPKGHIDKSEMLCHLGDSYIGRFEQLKIPQDLILSIRIMREAALLPSGGSYHRLQAALECARICMALQIDKEFALKHYEMAMDLLTSVVWLGTTIRRRYKDVSSIESVATEAATAAIKYQEYGLALEWLEQGRSIVWQQTLNLRTPFGELSQVEPSLTDRLKEIAHQLDFLGTAQTASSDIPNNEPMSEKITQRHRRLAEDWERILEEVRCIPGFQSFMRPRKAEELVRAARSSTVVVVNIHGHRCDALVLRPNSEDVTHVLLANLSPEKVAAAYRQLTHSLQRKGVRERGVRVGQSQQVDMLESILSLLWSDVVRPVLEFLGYTCTTGPLAFLPLHAAGCYSKPESRVYNYAISSYTPTLSALISSSQNINEFQGILAVSQTDTPGFQSLPGTTQELKCISQQAQGVTYTQLDGEKATAAAVLEAIETHSWVHLACHASQNASDPTASAFHLHDGALSLATIMRKSFKNAGLAFLSACQTAKGDADLPDEAVHLAAGMLMAGFPAVIATMWSIQDRDAPLIAEEVYAVLLEGGKPDNRRAAKALHKAVGRLREEVGENAFTSWVPYVHLGI